MSHSIEPNIVQAVGRFPDAFREMCREQKRRRIERIRGAIHVEHYETARKLDTALDSLLDSEGFTSRPPVTTLNEEALDQLCQAESTRVIDYGGSHNNYRDSAIYRDACDLAGE